MQNQACKVGLGVPERSEFEHVDRFQVRKPPKRLAAARGIHLAVSNPCFELWVLLHFVAQHAYIETPAVVRKLRRHLPEHDKHLKCELLRDCYDVARDRAAALAARHEKDGTPGANPSTDVFLLVERLRASAPK